MNIEGGGGDWGALKPPKIVVPSDEELLSLELAMRAQRRELLFQNSLTNISKTSAL